MKKKLIVGSMIIFLNIEQELKASFLDDSYSDSSASGFVYESTRSKTSGGDANHIIEALGLEWSMINGVYMNKDSSAWGWDSYYNAAAYIPGIFQSTEGPEAKRKKEEKMIAAIEKYYAKMRLGSANDIQGDSKLMSEQITKDIQALEDELLITKYSRKAKDQLTEFINLAQDARNNINKKLINQFATSIEENFQKELESKSVADLIIIAGVNLAAAKKSNNQAAQVVYPKLISWLKDVQREVEIFEKKDKDFDEAIKLAQEAKRKYGSDVKKNALYDAVIAQLKINKEKSSEEGDKVSKETSEISQKFDEKANPKDELKKAKVALQKLQNKKTERMKYGLKANSPDILKIDKDIKAQLKLIDAIEVKIDDFENDVDRKIEEVLTLSHGDKKKAVESLLPKITTKKYAYSFWDNASVQQERTDGILTAKENGLLSGYEKAVKYEAAKKLQEQIQQNQNEAVAHDPLAMARARLATAPVAEIPAATKAVTVAMLAKGGITMDKLPYDVKESLQVVLSTSSEKMASIVQNTRLSEGQKLQQKQAISKKLIEDITTLCSPSFTGFSVAALKSGDPLTIAVDGLANQLMKS